MVDYIAEAQSWGFAWSPSEVKIAAQHIYGGVLGESWVRQFVKNNDLSSVLTAPLDAVRACDHDKATIEDFINLLRFTQKKYYITAPRKYNMDEKGVMLGQARKSRVTITKNPDIKIRNLYCCQPGNKDLVLIIEFISASGISCTPLIIFKARHYSDRWILLDDTAQGSSFNFSTSD